MGREGGLQGPYLDDPIKGLLGQFVLLAMAHEVLDDARPDALKLFQCSRHCRYRVFEL
jgi:hypothetical protein